MLSKLQPILFATGLFTVVGAVTLPVNLIAASELPAQITPGASGCTVEPLDISHIQELASNSFVSKPSTPDPGASEANADTQQAIDDLLSEAVECANANDPLRSLALFTDRYISERFGPEHPDDLGSLEAASSRTPTPASPDDRLTVVSITDVRAPAADRATATVITKNRQNDYVDQLTFVLVNGDWKIDSWSPISENGTPTA
jgi:hypothetical protein